MPISLQLASIRTINNAPITYSCSHEENCHVRNSFLLFDVDSCKHDVTDEAYAECQGNVVSSFTKMIGGEAQGYQNHRSNDGGCNSVLKLTRISIALGWTPGGPTKFVLTTG